MHVLVTGGSGFIGSHLVDRLLAEQHTVTVADNFLTGHRHNLDHLSSHPGLRLVTQDVSEPLSDALFEERFDRVYHLASPASPRGYARYPIETLLVNSLGTHNVLELACVHGARFLQASTSEVYGDPLAHPQTEEYWGNVNPVGPRACYDEGKRFSEALVMEYTRQRGLDGRIARIFNTYGPRSHPGDGRVVPNFCVQAIANQPITIYGTGAQTRSFCFVIDLVDGLHRLMEANGLTGEVVNLGNPEEHTIRQFAERIVALAGAASPIVFERLPEDDPQRRQPNIAKAQRLLGWSPVTSLDDGLQITLAAFREQVAAPEIAAGDA
jgi:dTDP-glucose 4,6-dehydratase/UDP-glucuronate decarboxylase